VRIAHFGGGMLPTQGGSMWGRIKNLLNRIARHPDLRRAYEHGLYEKAKKHFPELLRLEKEGGGSVMNDLDRLIEKYGKEIAHLEAQHQELNRKLDVLVEASRLLEEEVVAPHKTLYEELSDLHRKKD